MDDNTLSSSPLSQPHVSPLIYHPSTPNTTMPWLDSSKSNSLSLHDQLPPIQQSLSSQSRQLTTWAGVLKKAVADDGSRDATDILTNPTGLPDPLLDNLQLSTTQDLVQTTQLAHSEDKSDKPPPTPHHIFRPTETTAFLPFPPAHPVSLPTAVLHSENGTIKTSFRRWKWEASTLPRPAIHTTTHVLDNLIHNSTSNNTPSLQSATPSNDYNIPNLPNLQLSYNRSSQYPQSPQPPPEFEAMILSTMSRLSEAKPAALAAAAAFRAISPYLNNEERVSLHRSFATASPLDCLTLVVRSAEIASSRNEPSPTIFRQAQDSSLTHTPTRQPQSSIFSLESSSLGLLPNVAGQHGDLWVSPSSGRTAASWDTIDRGSRSILQETLQHGGKTAGSDSSPSSFDFSGLSTHLPNTNIPLRETETNQFFGLSNQRIQGSDLWWKTSTNNSNESDVSGSAGWDTYYEGYQPDSADNTDNNRQVIFSTPLPSGLNVNAPPFRVDKPSPSRNDGL